MEKNNKVRIVKTATKGDIAMARCGFFLYNTEYVDIEKDKLPVYTYIRSAVAVVEVKNNSIFISHDIETLKEMQKQESHIENEIIYDLSQQRIGIYDKYGSVSWLSPKDIRAVNEKAYELDFIDSRKIEQTNENLSDESAYNRIEQMPKHKKCRYGVPYIYGRGEEGKNYCAAGARTLGEMYENMMEIDISQCENCENYKSMYIEYPLTIEKLNIKQPSAWGIQFKPVRVRLCEDNRTYFGILLGEFPWMTRASYSDDTGELEISTTTNPCILIPELNRVVFGAESWWGVIKPGEDISDITDDDIENVWYMKLLRSMNKEE